jgi:hypothetical protein
MSSKIRGLTLDSIVVDEWEKVFSQVGVSMDIMNRAMSNLQGALESKRLYTYGPLTFTDPKYERSKHDPLNRNPSAGRSREYVVVANGRRSNPLHNSVKAELQAKALHERMVAALIEAEQAERQNIPTWGMF